MSGFWWGVRWCDRQQTGFGSIGCLQSPPSCVFLFLTLAHPSVSLFFVCFLFRFPSFCCKKDCPSRLPWFLWLFQAKGGHSIPQGIEDSKHFLLEVDQFYTEKPTEKCPKSLQLFLENVAFPGASDRHGNQRWDRLRRDEASSTLLCGQRQCDVVRLSYRVNVGPTTL